MIGIMSATEIQISKDDIPWIEQTILDARLFGHHKVANILSETLEQLLRSSYMQD
jgi:CRP-like cAMP-binding protein